MKPVIIVGGGLSGLAAGVGLSSRGIPVHLLDQRSSLGGRTYSYTDGTTGDVIDNGQHVLIAGYVRTLRYLETIGTRSHLAIQTIPSLRFHHPRRGFCSFRVARLPSPFHLLGGGFISDLFSVPDKLRLLQAGAALHFYRDNTPGKIGRMTIEQWLDSVGQSADSKRSFWEPLAIAIMNEHIAVASARVFLRALRTAFLETPGGAAMAIPTVGLSDLFVDAARVFIERHGGIVRCHTEAVTIVSRGGHAQGVRTRTHEIIGCSALVLAVPAGKAAGLIPSELQSRGFLFDIASVPFSPIISIHLWFAADFMPEDFLGVIGRRIHWVFNRRKILREKGFGGHVSAVISAAHAYVAMTNEQLAAVACEDLSAIYGPAAERPLHAVVIREKRATFSCTPEVDALRPGPRTPVGNLFLAGDWTATGFPATIEGAIISGERCVDLVMAFLERVA